MIVGQILTSYSYKNRIRLLQENTPSDTFLPPLQTEEELENDESVPDIDDIRTEDGEIDYDSYRENVRDVREKRDDIIYPTIIKFNRTYIDCRIHGNYIQKSGSGKSEGNSVIRSITEMLDFVLEGLSDTTSAGLIGNENEGNAGALAQAEFIMMDEAQEFYEDGKTLSPAKAKTRDYMNQSMNTACSKNSILNKKLRDTQQKIYPLGSYMLSSYETDNMFDVAQHTGFFQRSLTYNRILSFKEHMTMQDCHTKGIFLDPLNDNEEREYSDVEYRKDREIVVQYLKSLKEFVRDRSNWEEDDDNHISIYKNTGKGSKFYTPVTVWDVTPDDDEMTKNELINSIMRFSHHYRSVVNNLSDEVKDYSISFFSRMRMHLIRLAVHHAVMNKRNKLSMSDITYASGIIFDYMDNTVEWIEKWSDFHEDAKREQSIVKKHVEKIKAEYDNVLRFRTMIDSGNVPIESRLTKVEIERKKCAMNMKVDTDYNSFIKLSDFKKLLEVSLSRSKATINRHWNRAKSDFEEIKIKGNSKWVRPLNFGKNDIDISTGLDDGEVVHEEPDDIVLED